MGGSLNGQYSLNDNEALITVLLYAIQIFENVACVARFGKFFKEFVQIVGSMMVRFEAKTNTMQLVTFL